MTQQSSALRNLEDILSNAIDDGDRKATSGHILLTSMGLSIQPNNLVDFYKLLNNAEEEARKIQNRPKINRYLKTIEELHREFITRHIWTAKWNDFAVYIENKNILNTLDSLADFFYSENPGVLLEEEFLDELNIKFSELQQEIIDSDLNKELKIFLVNHINNILSAIRRYNIDGTAGLKIATQSFVNDLMMAENSLKDEKKKPIYTKAKAWILAFLLYIHPSPYDIIGAVPDLHDFWIPKIEELSKGQEKVQKIISETPNIQLALEKATNIFERDPQKCIEGGKAQKALAPATEDPKANINS